MNKERDRLASELKAFDELSPISNIDLVADAYNRILLVVQAFILTQDDPDSNTRAWELVNDDAYKQLTDMQEGKGNTLDGLKHTMSQVGRVFSIT